jgi:excisionase family DNA binding protein
MSDYVTAAEAAAQVGCSETHIRRLIERGVLEATKKSRRWRILRADLDDVTSEDDTDRTTNTPTDRPDSRPTARPTNSATDQPTEWRADLLAQVARLEAERVGMRDDFDTRLAEQRQESGLLVETSKARVIDLERELTVRDSRIVDLSKQVSVLEAKVRETLEAHAEKLGDLASDIAELANAKARTELRVYELEPVASQVPMLQAAVEEKDATLSERDRQLEVREHELSQVRDDIDAMASRPVTGPVFRLLTKGRLRR